MSEDNFFSRIRWIQRVGPREINDVYKFPLNIDLTVGVFDRCAWKIGRLRLQACNGIKKCTFATIRLSYEYDIWKFIFFRQLPLLKFF